SSFGGFTGAIALTNTTTAPAGTSVTITSSPVTVGNSFTVTLNNANTLAPDTYSFVISGTSTGAPNRTVNVSFQISPGAGPSISTQPANQAVCSGATANFSVVAATGSSYQWQLNTGAGFTNISGATSATYTESNVSLSMSGYSYRCIVYGQCGNTTSSEAALTINASPEITNEPTSLTQCTGTVASFSVGASGGVLSYQWQVSTDGGANYSNIAGATAATYTIASTALSQNNNKYRCVVSGACSPAATSSAASLMLSAAPTITVQPITSASICDGGSTSFTVAATTPIGTLSYQWQASANNGATWTDVAAATNATFSQTNVPVAQNGYLFRVGVTTSCGTIYSTNVALTVNAYPVISIAPVSQLCVSDQPVSLTASPAGGVFSGAGVTGTSFNPRTAGVGVKSVTYTVSNQGCESTLSSNIIVDQCAERQIPLENPASLTLYPNPNTGRFGLRVNTDLYSRFGVKVYNNVGQLVRTQNINNVFFGQVLNMDLSRLPAGTYHLLVINDEQTPVVTRTINMVIYK
ncbi:MAG: T9SS type A sorting domain-containing protein, partial [Chitinophagaceae bacterium]